jgi:hypothetical protein
VLAKRVDPEVIEPFRVARGDMARETLVVTITGEQAERARKTFLPVAAFRGERWGRGYLVEPVLAQGFGIQGNVGRCREDGAHRDGIL